MSRAESLYPDISPGGRIHLWRNEKDAPFDDADKWDFTCEWRSPEDISAAWADVLARERKTAQKCAFAWNDRFGYLSPDPAHIGPGIGLEAEFHLEGLHLIGELEPVRDGLEAVRFASAGLDRGGMKAIGHVYTVSTATSFGLTEKKFVRRAEIVYTRLLRQEANARLRLMGQMHRVYEDAIARALAILKTARLLSPSEIFDILSPLRLAAQDRLLDGMTAAGIAALMRGQIRRDDNIPDTAEGDRMRDARDATLADRMNALFADVKLSAKAKRLFR